MRRLATYVVTFLLVGCASVPVTQRKQLSVVSESEIISSSSLVYESFLTENQVYSPYNTDAIMVKRVGDKLADACRRFLQEHGDVQRLQGFDWQFNLVEGEEINAWCMPGGKVMVYDGILPVTQNEEGLAVVLSHEIAHAVARHGSERVSQQILASYGSALVSSIFENTVMPNLEIDDVIEQTYGTGMQLALLKFSRVHETEADKMGLVFMEYAGYDSQVAIDFWKRMALNSKGQSLEFMSTHPSDQKRILEIESFIPVAKSYVN